MAGTSSQWSGNMSKHALITGAGARLGRAMAEAVAADGWDVAIHYASSRTGAEETASAVRSVGATAALVQADLRSESETSGLVDAASRALGGPITLLVNSASTFFDDTAEAHDRNSWDLHMDVNLRAPVHLAQTFANALPADLQGLIINLIDQRVLKLNPQFFTYTLSKTALWTATRTLAQSLAPNIRVNGIGPGPTLRSIHQSQEEFDKEAAATLTQKGSSPDEIVRALRYLIEATSVTGQMIAADGGQHLLWKTADLPD